MLLLLFSTFTTPGPVFSSAPIGLLALGCIMQSQVNIGEAEKTKITVGERRLEDISIGTIGDET